MEKHSLDRRTFLARSSLLAGAALTAPRYLRARQTHNKLNIAVIGTGGRGGSNLNSVGSENIVALCDVSKAAVARAARKHSKARQLADFRKVFDHAKEFDAVVVSICEHTHALA